MGKKKFKENDYFSLSDEDVIMDGDVIEDLENGEYRLVVDTSIDWLLEGMTVFNAKKNKTVNTVLRKKIKQHYKKLIHWKRYEQTGVKMLCGYDNFCIKTTKITKDVTCPKCLELIEYICR